MQTLYSFSLVLWESRDFQMQRSAMQKSETLHEENDWFKQLSISLLTLFIWRQKPIKKPAPTIVQSFVGVK